MGWLNGFDKKEYGARLQFTLPFLEEPDKPNNKAPKNEKNGQDHKVGGIRIVPQVLNEEDGCKI